MRIILALVVLLAAPPVTGGQDIGKPSVRTSLDSAAEFLHLGRPRGALEALRGVATVEPDNPWMWFYRGSAHLQLDEPYRALECYDRALEILVELGDPDPALSERIRAHRARARREVFCISLQTGLAFDTNVTYLGGGAVGFADRISGREDGKFASLFQVAYAPIADELEALTVGVRLGHFWHFAVEEFDYQDYGTSLRYARRIGDNLEAAVRYDYDIIFLGNEPFLSNHALTPSLSYHWQPGPGPFRLDRSTICYQFEARDFLFETLPELDRDGVTHGVGVEQSFLFDPVPDWTWDLNVGYRFTSIPTEGTEFDRSAHDFHLGLGIPLVNPAAPDEYLIIPDKELVFRFNVQWQIADYREDSIIDSDGDPRSDLLTGYGWSLSQKLVEDPNLGDLTLHGIIQWTDANSNVTIRDQRVRFLRSSPFTYDKVVYGVQLEWSW